MSGPNGSRGRPGHARIERARLLRWALLAVPTGALLYVGALSLPGARETMAAMARFGFVAITIGIVLEAISNLALAEVYRSCLRALGTRLPFLPALGVSMSAFTVSRLVPAGGAMGAVVAVRRMTALGVAPAVATTSVVLMGTCAMLTLGVLVTLGAVAASFRTGVPASLAAFTAILAGVIAVAVVVVLGGIRSDRVRAATLDLGDRIAGRFGGSVESWRRSLDAIAERPPSLRQLGDIGWWSAVNWMLDVAVVWVLFRGAGDPTAIAVVLVGVGVANLGAALPLTPGGIGFVEAGMAGTYVALGTEPALAIAIVLVYRVISFWLPALAGAPVYLRGPRPRPPDVTLVDPVSARRLADAPAVSGLLALQGGMEHQPGCEPIDRLLLDTIDKERPVVVLLPVASAPHKRPTTIALARTYWRDLGAELAVIDLADPATIDVLDAADLLVLPGGAPRRLMAALAGDPVWAQIHRRHAEGRLSVSGASAGAMVLGGWLPELRLPDAFRLRPGLGVLPGCAIAPHYDMPIVKRWAARALARRPDVVIVGLDDRTGIVSRDGRTFEVAGQGHASVVRVDGEQTFAPGDRLVIGPVTAPR
jgi:uncharacterized protein (TIRG00374 family)